MKKFIGQVFLFFFLFSAFLVCIGKFDNVGRSYNSNANIQKLTCMSSFDSLDILFVGNSYCYSGINPAYFDSVKLKTYNLGVATAGVNYYTVLINDYIRTVTKKPKSVFIVVSPFILSGKSDDALNNPVYRFLNHPVSNEKYILSYDPGLIKSYPKICARSFARAAVSSFNFFTSKKNFSVRQNNDMYLSKGFIASAKVNTLKDELKTNYLYEPLLKNKFNENKAQQLFALAEGLESENIKVVFFELPSNKLYSFFNKEYLAAYHSFLNALGDKFVYMPVKLNLDSSYYRDQDHLNAKGAGLACKAIIAKIESDKNLSRLLLKK
jgi:hypothetical protein